MVIHAPILALEDALAHALALAVMGVLALAKAAAEVAKLHAGVLARVHVVAVVRDTISPICAYEFR